MISNEATNKLVEAVVKAFSKANDTKIAVKLLIELRKILATIKKNKVIDNQGIKISGVRKSVEDDF